MKPYELLTHWPSWKQTSPAERFASPAWQLRVNVQGAIYFLKRAEKLPNDLLALRVAFEDEEIVVALADSPLFAELHTLWAAREEIPPALLLALLEKSCGLLFQALENALNRQLAIKEVMPFSESVARISTPLVLTNEQGAPLCTLTAALTPPLIEELGQWKAMDVTHPSIRAMSLPVRFELAAFALNATDVAGLAPGDALLLPEVDGAGASTAQRWVIGDVLVVAGGGLDLLTADDDFHVEVRSPMAITFGDLCEGRVPRPNDCSQLALTHRGRLVAQGHLETLGAQRCLAIEEVM